MLVINDKKYNNIEKYVQFFLQRLENHIQAQEDGPLPPQFPVEALQFYGKS